MHQTRDTWSTAALVVAVALGLAQSAFADALSFGGIPLKNVQILTIENGQIHFFNQGGIEVRRPLVDPNNPDNRLRWIEIDSVPELAKAEGQLKDKNYQAAIPTLQAAKSKARDKWLKTWIDVRLLGAYDGAKRPVDAVRAYLDLYKAGADDGYLSQPPTQKSIIHLKADEKAQMLKELADAKKAVNRPPPEQYASLVSLIEQLDVEAAQQALANTDPATGEVNITKLIPKSEIPLPVFMMQGTTDPATKALMAGKFQEALDFVNQKLDENEQGKLYQRLYQRGVAQLYLAEQSNDKKMLKDAGLSFMRVVVYNSRGKYAGPSYIEAGRVHALLGRSDLARQLYDQATNYIVADEEPTLAKRLDTFKSDLVANKAESE